MMKLLMGGSPCTHWSIAQTKNRETEPSGIGWELFENYMIALEKFKPDYFLYENNKSMSQAIRAEITKRFGFEPICINSALVSAQNRQRLYWCGKRNDDGTYSLVDVQQPEDRGILLSDILESGVCWREKCYALLSTTGGTTADDMFSRHQRNGAAEPVAIKPLTEKEMEYMVRETKDGRNHFDFEYFHDGNKEKSSCVTANTHKGVPYNVIAEPVNTTTDGKAQCLRATYYKDGIRNMVANDVDRKTCVAEPICVNSKSGRGGVPGLQPSLSDRIYSIDGKATALTTAFRPNIAEIVRIGTIESKANNADFDSQQYRVYSPDGNSVTLCGKGGGIGAKTGLYAVPVAGCVVGRRINEQGHRDEYNESIQHFQYFEVNEEPQKTNCLTTVQKDNMIAVPVIPDGKGQFAIKAAGGKEIHVYEVRGGRITIKGKTYPIKLADGYYIIRKLTVNECKRLQTVPDGYEFPVSDTQAYKMLGNGWTVDVICHILSHCYGLTNEPLDVLSMYDGMACGHIALDKLGAKIHRYRATEIDKYAIKTSCHNFPDIEQLGDAFQVREEQWVLEGVT